MHEDRHDHICSECDNEFATAKELGEHVDNVHREQTTEANPTNVGPGITEQYETD